MTGRKYAHRASRLRRFTQDEVWKHMLGSIPRVRKGLKKPH